MEEVLLETLQRGKKLYEVGSEILLRPLSPRGPLFFHHPSRMCQPYLICQQPSFLQHVPAGSLYLILEAEEAEVALGQGLVPIIGPAWPSPTLQLAQRQLNCRLPFSL